MFFMGNPLHLKKSEEISAGALGWQLRCCGECQDLPGTGYCTEDRCAKFAAVFYRGFI
jgi:hypothetical protein